MIEWNAANTYYLAAIVSGIVALLIYLFFIKGGENGK